MLRALFILTLLCCAMPVSVSALVSEGRPGIPYFGHVLFLQHKVIENGEVVAVSLGYTDPRSDKLELCSNRIDVFNGLELFLDIPERTWVLVDYELQSILVADGFAGDADVFSVSACPDVDTCQDWSEKHKADPRVQQFQAERPRAKTTIKANLESIQQRLDIGRKLVRAARCRGCHSLEGFGPKHAPSLTWKRFKYENGWLEKYLQAPYRMRPAMRDLMMLKYTSPNAKPNLKPQELELVAEYLTNVATASAPNDQYRRELWQDYDCYSCHTRLYQETPLQFVPTAIPEDLRGAAEATTTFQTCLGCHPFGDVQTVGTQPPGAPNVFATDLLLAFEKLTLNYLSAFLANPSYLEPQTRMPNLGLSDEQISDILAVARKIKGAIATGRIKPVHVPYELEKRAAP